MMDDVDVDDPFVATWDDNHDLVRVVWLPGSICTMEAARRSTDAVEALGKDGAPLIVDMREMKKLEKGAREHFQNDKAGVSAMALLIESPVTRMLANFFMKTDRDSTPTRMFTSEDAALEWLRSLAS